MGGGGEGEANALSAILDFKSRGSFGSVESPTKGLGIRLQLPKLCKSNMATTMYRDSGTGPYISSGSNRFESRDPRQKVRPFPGRSSRARHPTIKFTAEISEKESHS